MSLPSGSPGGRGRLSWALVLLVAVNLLLAGANSLVWGTGWRFVEDVARGKAERSMGRARSMRVQVWSTTWFDLLGGRVRLVRFDAQRLRLKNGLRVSTVSLLVQGVKASADSITDLQGVRWFVRVKEADLNRFLQLRGGLLHPVPSVRLLRGEMEVTARQLFIELPVKIRGRLRVQEGTQIHFDVPSGWDVKGIIVSGALSYLNPIVDLRDAHMAKLGVSIARLQIMDGVLELEGTASPPLPFVVPSKPEPEASPEADDDPDDPGTSPSPLSARMPLAWADPLGGAGLVKEFGAAR